MKQFFVLVFSILTLIQANGQNSSAFKKILNNPSFTGKYLHYPKQVMAYYYYAGFRYCWLTDQGRNNVKLLYNYIQNCGELGLRKEDYQPGLFKFTDSLFLLKNEQDSLSCEIKFTDIAIHFIHDILVGNQNMSLAYNGLNYSAACYDIAAILKNYLDNGKFKNLLKEIEPSDSDYLAIKKKLNSFQEKLSSNDFADVVVNLSPKNSNHTLLKRLYQLGFINSDISLLSDHLLTEKIKDVQNSFNLSIDGIAGKSTLQALNVPLKKRVAELAYSLNTIRALTCMKQQSHFILVNIPSATLLLYDHNKIVLESKVIVGKASTPTPTLSSKITEVVLYPYWNVPYKIATRELLPLIKQDPSFIESNNYQVLSKNGKILNPSSVNWNSLSTNYFPYLLRQSTGCDNSLGLIKLNFYNPFTVYLHDTPAKYLFNLNERYFSHGCIRVEKAIETGRYVLKDNPVVIDTLTVKGCLKNQFPIVVPASENIPVFVLYQTVWFDSKGAVRFYKDIYGRF